jgi:hypothetical protein
VAAEQLLKTVFSGTVVDLHRKILKAARFFTAVRYREFWEVQAVFGYAVPGRPG